MSGKSAIAMARPRVKAEHAPYRIGGGKIRIGGISYPIAAEIDDPAGWVWTLLMAMDGSRELSAVVDHVYRAHPELTEETVLRGAEQLVASGYVEDAVMHRPAGLSERDLERYDRATGFFRWMDLAPRQSSWEPQELLRNARVTLLGVGGTGGVAAMALAASGVGKLHCVDPDVVELSNLSRQVLYTEDDIGTQKAAAAVARLRRLNSDIEVTGERLEARGTADVGRLAAGCDVLLLAADQPLELREWANTACLAARRPWVYAGYHGPRIQVGTFVPGTGACLECLLLENRDEHAALGVRVEDAPGPNQAVHRAVGAASAGISGYLAAHQVIAMITGIPPVVPGRIDAVNLVALDAPFSVTGRPRADCPACRGAG